MSVSIAIDVCARSATCKGTCPIYGTSRGPIPFTFQFPINIITFYLPGRNLGLGMFRNLLQII